MIMKKLNENKKTIFKKFLYWIFICIMMLFLRYVSFNAQADRKMIFFIGIFVIALIIDIILNVIKKQEIEFYKKFILISSIFGIIYCIVTPIGTANDEASHYLRIYEISEKYTSFSYEDNNKFPSTFSKLIEFKNNKNIGYNDYIENFSGFNINDNEQVDLGNEYMNTKIYSPLQYLPQTIGMMITKIFSKNVLTIGIVSRLFGLAFWIAICAYSLKIIPNKKTFFAVLILLPISLCSASCLSGDTVTNAMCILFLSIIYKKFYNKEKLDKKEKIILIISSCMIALCKVAYLPLIFLVLILNKENFENKKQYIRFSIVLILISCIIGLAWLYVGSNTLASNNSDSLNQVKFILENPLKYCLIMMQTYLNEGANYIFQLTTGYELLCDSRVLIYTPISYIISIILMLALLINEKESENKLGILRKVLIILILIGTILVISTAIYVQWTSMFEVGYPVILGIQGRYFIPIVALLIFLIDNIKINLEKEKLINGIILMQLPVIFLIMNAFVK